MDTGIIRRREEQEQNAEEIRESIDAYVENQKRAIENFVDKLTVEICKDIDRYKEEIMNGMAADNVVEDVRGSLSSLEMQYFAAPPIEDKEAALSVETKEAVLSIKTIEWMKEVEKYAIKYKLTSEILEGINQCKKRIKAENADCVTKH